MFAFVSAKRFRFALMGSMVFGASLALTSCGGEGTQTSQNDASRAYCGTPEPTASEILAVESAISLARPPLPSVVTIPVYVHVITMSDGSLNVSDEVIANQIVILNDAFAGLQSPGGYKTRFKFQFVSTDRTANSAWCTSIRDSADEIAMKTALRMGSADDLNLYIRDLQPGLGGYGGFPWWYAGNPAMDGWAGHRLHRSPRLFDYGIRRSCRS